MEFSPTNSAFESWFDRCSELCSSLTRQGFKYTFSLNLEGSFSFSLSSEKAVPPRTKKRSTPSYRRRQQRRREDLLRKRSEQSPAEKAAGHHQEEEAAVDTPLNLCPKPVHPRISTGSLETEDDADEIEQWTTGGTVTEKPVLASQNVRPCSHFICWDVCLIGSDPESEPEEKDQEAGSVDQGGPLASPGRSPNEPQRNQWTSVSHKRQTPKTTNAPMTPVRQIPASRSTLAKPSLTDRRHSIWNHKGGTETIVFAPAEVSYDDIIKVMKTPVDWSYVRPTSHRCDKWVYYPKENAENV